MGQNLTWQNTDRRFDPVDSDRQNFDEAFVRVVLNEFHYPNEMPQQRNLQSSILLV